MRQHRLVPAIIVAAFSLGLTSCGSEESPAAVPPSPMTSAPNIVVSTQGLDTLGRTRYPDTYGGLRVVDRETGIVVYLTERNDATERALTDAFAPMPVTFETTPQSLRSLDRLLDRVGDAVAELERAGVQVSGAGTDISRGVVVVNVKDLRDGDLDLIRSAAGSTLVEVRDQGFDAATSAG